MVPSAHEALTRLLGERTGLAFAPGRRAWAETGIRRAIARAGVADPAAFLELVRDDDAPDAMEVLIDELTVGETYFFREPEQFRFLRETILPEVRARKGERHDFRAWSAGCASGEEAYSMAIALREGWPEGRAHLLATDISPEALAKASAASYADWSFRGEDAEQARPYLHRRGRQSEVIEEVRQMVEVRPLNLALDDYPSPTSGAWEMDLIFCRNVLIYLEPDAARVVARRLHDSLAEGGWLIAASSDPPLAGLAPFEPVATDGGTFYRRAASGRMRRRALPPHLAFPPDPEVDPLAEARESLARGDYALAAIRSRGRVDAEAQALHIRALANLDVRLAERASAEATNRHPLCTELRHLRAVLLLDLDRAPEAAREARHAIYIDRTSAMAHFTLGSILLRLGDRSGAWRAYRNARDLVADRPPDEPVPLSDGETAGRLARAAESQMGRLESLVVGVR